MELVGFWSSSGRPNLTCMNRGIETSRGDVDWVLFLTRLGEELGRVSVSNGAIAEAQLIRPVYYPRFSLGWMRGSSVPSRGPWGKRGIRAEAETPF